MSQQSHLVISSGHGTSLTPTPVLDKKILLALLPLPPLLPSSSSRSSCCCSTPPGQLPSHSLPSAPLRSPMAAAAPGNSGPHPNLQPCLTPEHRNQALLISAVSGPLYLLFCCCYLFLISFCKTSLGTQMACSLTSFRF